MLFEQERQKMNNRTKKKNENKNRASITADTVAGMKPKELRLMIISSIIEGMCAYDYMKEVHLTNPNVSYAELMLSWRKYTGSEPEE